MACYALAYPGYAGDQQCDLVLEFAAEVCIQQLAENPSSDAAEELQHLRLTFCKDGGDSLMIKSAIQRQDRIKLGREQH